MLQNLAIKVVLLPFAAGMIVGLLRIRLSGPAFALIIPVVASAILVTIEGFPALPPPNAVQKLPYVLAAAGFAFALYAVCVRVRSAVFAAIASLVAFGLPMFWLGRNILANNSHKLIIILGLLAFAAVITWLVVVRTNAGKGTGRVLPQAILATSLAAAVVSVTGGYIGMGMFNGGLAAFTGGYLLFAYFRYLRGQETAFHLEGIEAYAFAWVAMIGVMVTALLAPVASVPALFLTAVTLAATPLLEPCAVRAQRFSYVLRPLACGLIVAGPAIVAMIIAGLKFAG